MNSRGKYLIRNGHLHEFSMFDLAAIEQQKSIYEVIRLMDGTPLFFEKHLERMNNSAILAGLAVQFDGRKIFEMIGQLAKANGIDVGNVKLIYPLNSDQTGEGLLAFFIPHSYPATAMYENGVSMLSLKATRPDPKAKITNQTLRLQANHMIAENNIYEVLLVNEDGLVTEGSRSNIFFIKNDQIITPPENLVLAGITRNFIIQICQNENIPFVEKNLTYPELSSCSAAFITGTSPKVLPVNKIDDFRYHTGNPVVLKIMRKYDENIERYLATNK